MISRSTRSNLNRELIPYLCRYAVTAQKGFETMLVVDNIPIVDVSKKQRLLERLRQTFAKVGAPVEEESIDMPWNGTAGTNKGYVVLIPVFLSHALTSVASISFVFLTYPDVKEAENAVHVLEGVSFGKNILHVNRFGDIQRFASLPIGEGDLPAGWKEKDYIEKVRFRSCLNPIRKVLILWQDYLRSWLGDLAGRDQYVTFWDTEVSIWWNGRNGNAEILKGPDGKPVKNNVGF